MRPLFIAGNWKMNPPTREAALALAREVKAGVGSEVSPRVAVCPPSIFLHAVDDVLAGSPIGLGGQNMHGKLDGAYTGELCGPMLVDAGCTHVILGHSERRHGLGETNTMVNEKLVAALSVGLIPIVCIGETLGEPRGRARPNRSSPHATRTARSPVSRPSRWAAWFWPMNPSGR